MNIVWMYLSHPDIVFGLVSMSISNTPSKKTLLGIPRRRMVRVGQDIPTHRSDIWVVTLVVGKRCKKKPSK